MVLFGDLPSLEYDSTRLPDFLEHEAVPLSAFTWTPQRFLGHNAVSRIVTSFCERALTTKGDIPHSEVGETGGRQCESGYCAMMGSNNEETCEKETCVDALGHMNSQIKDMNKEVELLKKGLSKDLTISEVQEHVHESQRAAKEKGKPFMEKMKETTSIHAMIDQIKQQMKDHNLPVGLGGIGQSFRPLAESIIVEAGPQGLGADVKQFAYALQELRGKVEKNLTKEKIATMTSQDVPDNLKDTILALNEVLAGGTYLRSHLNKFSELANLGLSRAEIVGHANLRMGHTPVSPMEEEEVAMSELTMHKMDQGHLGPWKPTVKLNPEQSMRYDVCLRALMQGKGKELCHPDALERVQTDIRTELEDATADLTLIKKKKAEEAEALRKKIEEAEALRKKNEEAEALRKKIEEAEALRKKNEEAEALRKKAFQEALEALSKEEVIPKVRGRGLPSPDVTAIITGRLWKPHIVVARSHRRNIKHFL